MSPDQKKELLSSLRRIADALEDKNRPTSRNIDLTKAQAFIWQPDTLALEPVFQVAHIDLSLLHAIDRVKDQLYDNTKRFADNFPANNVLLWGARGMGKSSLVKAVHAQLNKAAGEKLKLIEINREDIETLPQLMKLVRDTPFRFIIFCDDLSFEASDTSYKSLKTILDGGIEGRPDNVVFYATSNRRHLIPRNMMDNETASAIHSGEAIEEMVSLSDRFGLWLVFHKCSQDEYLAIVNSYIEFWKLPISKEIADKEALEWSVTRGSRSGRTAWQYIKDLAGRLGCRLDS